jgi:formylglycine-generating enzyme required for sulfatase activity
MKKMITCFLVLFTAIDLFTQKIESTPIGDNFVKIEGGAFQMGSDYIEHDEDGNEANSHERPIHFVTVKSFYMSKYEVTQKEWKEIMGNNPSYFKGDNLPVEQVSWRDAIEYCNKRSLKEGLTPAYSGAGDKIKCNWNATGYRLPTEAEWEYAAKGGNKDHLISKYSGSNDADAVAWYDENSGNKTHPVGTKSPNCLGLYDMSGNVWEWCWDWGEKYSKKAQINPVGASVGANRVIRGGSWYDDDLFLRSACRGREDPYYQNGRIGFRVVRP